MKIRFYKHNKVYGNNLFIDYDTKDNTFVCGDTASTSQPLDWYQMSVEVATKRELIQVGEQLAMLGVKSKGKK